MLSKSNMKSKRSAFQVIQTYFNLLNHVMISTVAIYMTFLCYNAGNRLISWHAWLCTLGVSLKIGSPFNKKCFIQKTLSNFPVPIVDDTINFGVLFGKCVVKRSFKEYSKDFALAVASYWIFGCYSWNDH